MLQLIKVKLHKNHNPLSDVAQLKQVIIHMLLPYAIFMCNLVNFYDVLGLKSKAYCIVY